MRENLEKTLCLEMINYQTGDANYPKKINDCLSKLSKSEEDIFWDLKNEIHEIYTWINTTQRDGFHKCQINSIQEYHENIAPVSSEILKLEYEFDITLKKEISQKFKDNMIAVFDLNYYKKFMKSINQEY